MLASLQALAADLQGRLVEAEAACKAFSEECPRRADLKELGTSVTDQLRAQVSRPPAWVVPPITQG